MKRRLCIAAIIAASFTSLAFAKETANIVIAGQIAFRITDPGSYGSATARETKIDEHVCQAISVENVGKPKMKVAQHDGLWSVYVGKTFLASVYPGDAHMYGTSPKAVANHWAARLKTLFPLAEPMLRAGDSSHTTAMDRAAAQAALMRKVKVPREHWGIVDLYMIQLWDARQVKEADRPVEDEKTAGRIIEDGARHFYTKTECDEGHEPGTCSHLSTCTACKAMMGACIDTPEAKDPDAAELAKLLATDADMNRAIKQALEYVRYIDGKRFMRERVRIAWMLYKRLDKRAEALQAKAEANAAAASTPTTAAQPAAVPAAKPGG